MNKTLFMVRSAAFGLWLAASGTAVCVGQQMAESALPDAPGAQSLSSSAASAAQPPHEDQQTKRILGIFPNFRAVSANQHLPPQSVKDKFVTAAQDSFDYSAFVLPALLAGEQDATRATPEFGHGGIAYGRYLWHSFADQTDENLMVEFIVPAVTREDTRYYTLGPGHRASRRWGYALSRAVVTRNDAGHDTFNASEVIGSGAAAGISNLYYPSRERSFGNTADKWGTNVGIDAATFVVREFWPDINHWLFHGKEATAGH